MGFTGRIRHYHEGKEENLWNFAQFMDALITVMVIV